MKLLFFDLGSGEVLLIVLAIFLVFGPGKIPELARNLGKFINEMKRATEDIKTEINREANRKEREEKLKEYKNKINDKSEEPSEEDKEMKPNEVQKDINVNDDQIIDKIKEPETSIPKGQ